MLTLFMTTHHDITWVTLIHDGTDGTDRTSNCFDKISA